jgi:lipopolysaccharide transport system ATP-binding protein
MFVSHNLTSINRLCTKAIMLDRGALLLAGDSHRVSEAYLHADTGTVPERVWPVEGEGPGDSVARLHSIRIVDSQGSVVGSVDIRNPVFVEIEYWNYQSKLRPTVILHVRNADGTCLFATNDFANRAWSGTARVPSLVRARCTIPGNFLAEGQHTLLVAIGTYNPNIVHAREDNAVSFLVIDRSQSDGVRGDYTGARWPGVVRPLLDWQVSYMARSQ